MAKACVSIAFVLHMFRDVQVLLDVVGPALGVNPNELEGRIEIITGNIQCLLVDGRLMSDTYLTCM